MIDLHMVATPNGHKVSIMLEEVGLAYRAIPHDVTRGDQFDPAFLAISPNNKFPAIVDHTPADGGAPYALFESGAILLYLAEKTGRLLAGDLRGRHDTIKWLMFQMAGLGPMHGQAHHFVRYAPGEHAYATERYLREAVRLLRVLDRRLGEADYLAGTYSIADIACWPWVRAIWMIDLELRDFANLHRWYERIAARPAVVRGGAVLATYTPRAGRARKVQLDDEQWSAMFGERQHGRR